MIAAYAFLAAFAAQVLFVSIVNPTRLITYVRGWSANFGSERFAEQYPGFDYQRWVERFAFGFRAANFVIALLGVAILVWLFDVVQRPHWTGVANRLTPVYLLAQMSPVILLTLYVMVRYRKVFLQPSQEPKRTALLQRRGLFDFVSPLAVSIAALTFVLFFPFAILVDLYVYDNASLSWPCRRAMGSVVFVYALNAFIIYKMLYGRKNPFVTHESRAHSIGMTVKGCVYTCIAVVWFIVISSFFTKLELESWRPFAMTVFFVVIMLISFMELTSPSKKAGPGATAPAH